jgi:putative transposase
LLDELDPSILNSTMPSIHWPHAPEHHLSERGTYLVTAATYQKRHHFSGSKRLEVLHRGLLSVAHEFGWRLEAWAVFSNHYHFIGHSPESPESIRPMLAKLHERSAKWANQLDETPGRKVWHNFRETLLTLERSYLARLHYVHRNAVKHELVLTPSAYPWCSAGWFEKTASPAQVKTVYSFGTDRLNVGDDYAPSEDW